MSRPGNPHAFAIAAISASFARFSAGGAVTATFRTARPSAEDATPSMRSARARGIRRMATRTPSAAALRSRSLEEARGKVVDDQAPQKHQDQDEDDRRDVDTAEIRQERPDRAQRRLGYAIEKIADDRDAAVVPVDHAKGQQPAQHRLRDQEPNVYVDQRIDEPEQRSHMADPSPRTARDPSGRAALPQAQQGKRAAPFSRCGRAERRRTDAGKNRYPGELRISIRPGAALDTTGGDHHKSAAPALGRRHAQV